MAIGCEKSLYCRGKIARIRAGEIFFWINGMNKQGLFQRVFKLQEHGTTVRTEVIAGITTFLTMVYIVL